MKATELRIGNFLELTNRQAIRISIDSLKEIESGIHPYQKIPLTEKWLLKFGFEKLKSQRSGYLGFLLDEFEIGSNVRQEIYYYSCSNREEYRNQCNVDLTYVHQLQNLYFALTGEELKII